MTFILLFLLAVVSIILSAMLGTVNFSLATIIKLIMHHGSSIDATILFNLRLPRTFSAFITGGLLALAGCLIQALLRNPLADPYILGLSGGSAVFTLIAVMLGLSALWLTTSAFIGAIIAMLLVFLLSKSFGHWSPLRLLLIGVVLAAGWGAVLSFILALSPNQTIHGMLFWLMGDLSLNSTPYYGLWILLAGFLLSMLIARPLNILIQGELYAQSLGINTKRLNLILYFLSALLTSTAVSIAGTIGFIGLVTPHILRFSLGSDHRLIIPGSILLGGSLLTLADTCARIIIAPQQLPTGIFTALIGIPLFLFLLAKNNAHHVK